MIRHTYELIGHPGREHIIAKVRLKFWISQIGMLLCSVLSRCIVCNKFHSKPITQQMIPLLTSRMMAYQPLNSFSGMDLFVPFRRQASREYRETLVVPVPVLEHTCDSSRVGPLSGHTGFHNVFHNVQKSSRQGGPTEV